MSSKHLVDPTLLATLETIPSGSMNDDMLSALREWDSPQPPLCDGVVIAERFVPGTGDAPDIRILILTPAGLGEEAPALFHIHGGGLVSGRPDLYLTRLSELADNCRCVVIATSYRLAPETRWPGALEDILATFAWTHEHAAEVNVDPTRIAVVGESAGGGHAAALALHIRDEKGPPIFFQLLIYPMLDDRPLPKEHPAGEFIWTREHDHYGWSSLLGVPAGSDAVPAEAVPARASDLSGLPPTYIAVGALDLFVDADIEFARRLIAAGVPTELHVFPGCWHAFDIIAPETAIGARFFADIGRALRAAFDNSGNRHDANSLPDQSASRAG